jgi:FKBP-type peptidyl-prolyl cis-trans isomerase (trigger factor)
VATLTEANARLAKQLEDNSNELRELKALFKKERTERRGQRSLNPSKKILLDTRVQGCQYILTPV